MDYFKINNKVYDVLVMECEESYEQTDSENTGRTIAIGIPLTRDVLGTSITHKVTFKRKKGYEKEFDDLYLYLLTPRNDGFWVEMPHLQSTIRYKAYSSNGGRKVVKILKDEGKTEWDKFQANFIPMEAQYKPQ